MSILRISRNWTAMVAMASLASVVVSANLQAAIVVLNVNSSLSSLNLAGQVGGLGTPGVGGIVYAQQAVGSLAANYGGTITADLTAGVFTFSGGSAITAIVNPSGPFTTAPNAIGIEAGNYGITATGPVPAAGGAVLTINGVYKDLVLDIIAGTAQNGAATAASMNFSAGALDFGVSALAPSGPASLVGSNALNTSLTQVSWDGTTLRIPVAFQTLGGTGRVENWSGTIIAAVPEPSSIALMSLVGMVGLSYASIRGRRAKRLLS